MALDQFIKDVDWYARTHDRIRETFNEWLTGIEGRAPDEAVEGGGSTPADGPR